MEQVASSLKLVRAESPDPVLILDGLDRLHNVEDFWRLASSDLGQIRALEIPVVLAVPLAVRFEKSPRTEYFQNVYDLWPLSHDGNDGRFDALLAQRDTNQLMDTEARSLACKKSGGVMRDLISIARDAGGAAYSRESDSITKEHIAAAADSLGKSYLMGITQPQYKFLRRRLFGDPFEPTFQALLLAGLIVRHPQSVYRVHPAIDGVLQ